MPAFVMGPPARRLSRSHAPAAAHSPNRRRPGLAALVAGVFLAGLLAPVAIAGTSPNGDAAATWPTHWNAYTYADGSPIADPTGDQSPGYADISSGSPSGSLPSVYLASDGTNVFFRFRLADDPAGAGGFKSTAAVIRINVDGSLAAAVGLDGKSPKTDSVYVTDASGDAVVRVYETPFTSPSAGARSRSDGAGGYFLDLQVPIARIAAVSSSAVTGSTPVTLAFGTSQAANLAVINKDSIAPGATTTLTLATVEPPVEPPAGPTAEPTAEPTTEPSASPEASAEPSAEPSASPEASAEASTEPTAEPTAEPSESPEASTEPTAEPTAEPSESPEASTEPTAEPSESPDVETPPILDNRSPYFPSGDERVERLDPGTRPAVPDAVDPDGDSLTYSLVDGALPAGLVLGADGTWTGDVAPTTGTYVVTIQACDASGACASQVLTLVYGSASAGAVLPDTSTATPSDTGSHPSDVWLLVMALLASAASLALASDRIRFRGDTAK